MSTGRCHNEPTPPPTSLSTLVSEMTETLADFTAYVRFTSNDPGKNRLRLYDLRWQPTLVGDGALVRGWGRQGQPGTIRATRSPDRDQAHAASRQLVRRRLAHGYQVRDWH